MKEAYEQFGMEDEYDFSDSDLGSGIGDEMGLDTMEGVEGQDRESYTDDQDRENYTDDSYYDSMLDNNLSSDDDFDYASGDFIGDEMGLDTMEGVEGQDRESYTDDQDRENYAEPLIPTFESKDFDIDKLVETAREKGYSSKQILEVLKVLTSKN